MHSLRLFFTDKYFEILFSVFGLGFILNAINIKIKSPVIYILLAGIFILSAILIYLIRRYLFFKRITKDGLVFDFDSPRRAIIFTVGFRSALDDSILYKVYEKLQPEFIGFLETKETREKNIVKTIVERLNIQESDYKTEVVDPNDVKEIKAKTQILVDWFKKEKISGNEIVLDLTASTAVMSVASFMAADELNIDTLYLYSQYKDNKPIEGTQKPILIRKFEETQ